MPTYEGVAVFNASFIVTADDEIQAKDFIAEMAQEELPDVEIVNVIDIVEVK